MQAGHPRVGSAPCPTHLHRMHALQPMLAHPMPRSIRPRTRPCVAQTTGEAMKAAAVKYVVWDATATQGTYTSQFRWAGERE